MASTLKVNKIQHTGGTTALEIDSSGRMLTPARPAFKARRSGNQSLGAGTTEQALIMNVADFDIGSGYNTSTGVYTVPLGGIYYFFINARFDSIAAGNYARVIIHNDKTGAQSFSDLANALTTIIGNGLSTNYETLHASGLLQCDTNDTIKFLGGDQADTSVTMQQESQCGGFLVG